MIHRRNHLAGRARRRGMTLLEVMVSVAILAMMSILIYGVFESMSRGKKGEEMRSDRAHQGREAVQRIARELQTAYLSLHTPTNTSLQTRVTAFIAQTGGSFDRVDFAAFAHKRYERDAKESDQCELGYFAVSDPDNRDKMDLVRREQTPIDMYPQKGGVVNVLAEDIESFHMRWLDPTTATWVDTWDSTQITGQAARIPLEVKVTLVLRGVGSGPPYTFETKMMLPIQQPLTFAIPK